MNTDGAWSWLPYQDGICTAPREEQRIVAFLDLVGSTAIAERIGSLKFHALLSDVLARLSLAVVEFGGEVYRYVGDALIATWPLGKPDENARALRCLLACRQALESAAGEFMRRHGHTPEIRASLHCGPLVAGEIGGSKREVALIGDAMNTAARIEQACRTTGQGMLVSQTLLALTALPADIVAVSIGSPVLRGKSERLELFTLKRTLPCYCVLRACA
jgi:adenylate cyclase